MFSRIPFYSAQPANQCRSILIFSGLALFTAVLQTFLASFINGKSPLLYIFGKIAGAAAMITWSWIGLLPLSTQPLTRSLAHFTSFSVLGLVWFGIGIMLATQAVDECRSKTLWCATSSFATALAFLTGTFSGIAALLIWSGSKKTGAGLSVNVAQIDNRVALDY